MAAYTFSHNIDDSTAEVFSTYTTRAVRRIFATCGGSRQFGPGSPSPLHLSGHVRHSLVQELQNWAMKN